MKILGAAYTVHDQSICLIENGKIKFHYEFERLNRRKHNFISDNEEDRLLASKEFEDFVNTFKKDIKPDVLATSGMGYPRMNGKILPENFDINNIKGKHNPKNLKDNFFDGFIYYVDHHIAHAAYTYLTSGFKKSDILAYDGGGERFQTTFFNERGDLSSFGLDSGELFPIGGIWGQVSSQTLGKFASGKIMGLSSYGEPKKKHFEKLERYHTDKMREHLKNISFEDMKDFAATLQLFSTIRSLEFLAQVKTSKNLCISGGVGLNGYINQAIVESGLYENVHFPPAMGDDGISIGAALHAAWTMSNVKFGNVNLAYLGGEYKIPKVGRKYNYDDLYQYIAQKISEGKIVGWFQGRSESGPRALGNRSILADPRDSKMKDHLNESVKHREWYRPFAPSILKEEVCDWFENVEESKYMSKIAKFKPGMGEKVPAVCHVDYTGRLQTVTKDDNKHFYNLIKAFYKITNVPMVLNTSFNDNEEPIVETPQDAIKTFKKTNIDILVLGNRVLEK